MRVVFALSLILAAVSGAFAQIVEDESAAGIDADVLAAIVALATRDQADPVAAHLRNIHKSLAMNGKGYCGEVSFGDGGDFTVFHAILDDGIGPSVLRLADFPESDQSSSANTVRTMMRNFGCVE